MCATCGCSPEGTTHEHGHEHDHPHAQPQVLTLEQQVLARNDLLAARNRARLSEQRIAAVNLMGSPGAGKTTLLERTAAGLAGAPPLQVIQGDQETDRDARRLQEAGCPALQLNTGTGCHLDAAMVDRGLRQLALAPGSLLVIENVGNLVCPALFDLGEHARVVVSSVTEGDDKPLKYPHMFRAAALVVLNKVDLLPYVPFEPSRFAERVGQVNPRARVLPLSATRGDGLEAWYAWVRGLGGDGHA